VVVAKATRDIAGAISTKIEVVVEEVAIQQPNHQQHQYQHT